MKLSPKNGENSFQKIAEKYNYEYSLIIAVPRCYYFKKQI